MTRRKKNDVIKVFNVELTNIDRTYKGIDEWRTALQSAESITNPRRKRLYDLYKEVILDPHMSAVMEKRRLNVINNNILFFDKSGKENETVNRITAMPFFSRMIADIIDARFWGYSLLYFHVLGEDYTDYQLLPRAHVLPERGLIVKRPNDDTGVHYNKPPYSRYTIPVGEKNDLGLLLKAAPYVIYKKGDVADWSVYAQVFGTPFRKMTYDGHDVETKKKLEEIAANTGTAQYMIIPKQADLELIESNGKSGSSDLYKALAEFCDKQNSKLILGNTMTTDAEGGNYKGEVHQEVEKTYTQADKRMVLDVLNTHFVQILEHFGIPAAGGRFMFEEPDLLSLDDYIKLSKEISFDEDFFYDKYNIPKPKNTRKKSPEKKEGKEVTNTAKPTNERHLNDDLSLFDKFLTWLGQGKKKSLDETITALYPAVNLGGPPPLFNTQTLIDEALENVFSGVTPPDGIDPKLWQLSYQELNKAVDDGFGVVGFGEPDFDFTEQLKVNNGVFSAFKNHHQTKELAGLLRDSKGSLKSFSQFKKDATGVVGKYNRQWLKTEYNTAVRSARTARQWKGFEKTQHLYPNLEYLPSRAAHPRPEHVPFYHTVLPMDDPWWAGHTPPLSWNCLCGITNTDATPTEMPTEGGDIDPGLDNNPALTGKIFGSSHPYQAKTKQSLLPQFTRKAIQIERKMLFRWSLDNLRNKTYTIQQGQARVTRQSIKELINQPHKWEPFKNRLVLDFDKVIAEAKFIDTVPNIDSTNPEVKQYHYYVITLQGEESYINVQERFSGELIIYSITDKLFIKK